MSTEAAAAIIFGTLQIGISLAALYYQRQAQLRRQQRTASIPSWSCTTNALAGIRFEGQMHWD